MKGVASRLPVPGTFGAILLVAVMAAAQEPFRDDFSSDRSTGAAWVITSANDFNERVVEVSEDHRLRIRADTMGTRDDTVKFLGARLREAYPVGDGICVGATLDWNDQSNGSYLTAALVLAGDETDDNPLDLEDWLAVEYVGVPPGRNTRMQLRARGSGRTKTLEDEGWPDEQRTGRAVDEVRIELQVSPSSIRMWEDGELLYDEASTFSLEQVFIHLQLASHSNYRAREVYFDDVEVRRGSCEPIRER